jgi:hypothetical protein
MRSAASLPRWARRGRTEEDWQISTGDRGVRRSVGGRSVTVVPLTTICETGMRGVFVWCEPYGLLWLPYGGRRVPPGGCSVQGVQRPSRAFRGQGPVLAFPTW